MSKRKYIYIVAGFSTFALGGLCLSVLFVVGKSRGLVFEPIVENVGTFASPDKQGRVLLERNNPGGMGGYTTIITYEDATTANTEILSTINYGYGGTFYWLNDQEFCLVYDGKVDIFSLGNGCEGEFVDYFSIRGN